MLLKKIHIKNFKSLKDIQYDAVALNILMGLNGSGKSSFLQALLLLKQQRYNYSQLPYLALNGEYLSLGVQSDIFYCYNKAADVISISYQLLDRKLVPFVFPFQNPDRDIIDLEIKQENNSQAEFDMSLLRVYVRKMQYISANRLGPQQEHDFFSSKIAAKEWGINGENAVAFLAENGHKSIVNDGLFHSKCKDPTLQAQVNAWMSVISPGTVIHADKMANINKAILSVSYAKGINQQKFRPQNVGFGISFVLPIVVMILTSSKGDCLIIENPEAHIHPQGQAKLGTLIALCAESGVQIFVETHSDHIINGIRVAVKNKLINKKDVNLAFFYRIEKNNDNDGFEQYSDVKNIKIDSNGELSDYPDGFMDEWNNQLMELI